MTPFDRSPAQFSDPVPTPLLPAPPSAPEAAPPGDAVAALPCRPRRRRRIDRHQVAHLLAVGYPVSDVAEKVGCHRQHIWRLMRKSNRVRYAVAVAENEVGAEAGGRLAALRPTILSEVMRRMYEDRGVLLWAAKASGLADGGGYMPPLQAVHILPPQIVKQMAQMRQEIEHYQREIDRYERMMRAADGDRGSANDGDEDPDVS